SLLLISSLYFIHSSKLNYYKQYLREVQCFTMINNSSLKACAIPSVIASRFAASFSISSDDLQIKIGAPPLTISLFVVIMASIDFFMIILSHLLLSRNQILLEV